MRNNKRMRCTISRKLKRSEQLHFGSKIAACGNVRYETDIVAVAYCAPKPVWEEWMIITCFASYSAALRLLFIVGHTHRQGDVALCHRILVLSQVMMELYKFFTYFHYYIRHHNIPFMLIWELELSNESGQPNQHLSNHASSVDHTRNQMQMDIIV
jgi:hypothetical protein